MKKINKFLKNIGPGIVIAATGLGAGDMIAASVAGAKFGTVIIWSIILGALFKFVLNDGLAKWQLFTGTTLVSGWLKYFSKIVNYYFLVYLILWGFIVAAALISACGLAAHSIFPFLSVEMWGIIHTIIAFFMVYFGKYSFTEKFMGGIIAIMFIVIIYCTIMLLPDFSDILSGLLNPGIPKGSPKFILGVVGGVGGSVTILSYGYWMREKSWNNKSFFKTARTDLTVAYLLTGLFGIGILIIASTTNAEVMTGKKMVLELANRIEIIESPLSKWIFLIGFWGAVFSSMIGVYQGVPYIYNDFINKLKNKNQAADTTSKSYRGFLLFLAFPPLLLLIAGKPVIIVIIYSIMGALFMPFLATTLLILNNKFISDKNQKNNIITNIILVMILILFIVLFGYEFLELFK